CVKDWRSIEGILGSLIDQFHLVRGIIRSRCRLEELPGPTRRCLTSMRSLIVRGTKEELRDELLFYFIISNTTIWDFAEF
ncbi:hypothetical protein LINGRAHAP2_LOCUS5229, partial [Linum grandiflorum]